MQVIVCVWISYSIKVHSILEGEKKEVGNPTVSLGNRPTDSRGGSNLHKAIEQTNKKKTL